MVFRIKFSKYGAMKFVGHLDLMRYFQKAVKRAKLPVVYSAGYSPHQLMSFAAPLGVGISSVGEYMDLTLEDGAFSTEEVKGRLNAQMAEGVDILEVTALSEHAAKAMTSVAAAAYRVRFRPGHEPEFAGRLGSADEPSFPWEEKLSGFMQKPSIPVTKQGKRGERELDIRPLIHELRAERTKEGMAVRMLLGAGSAGNVKPELVMGAFCEEEGEQLDRFGLTVERLELYADTGAEGKPVFTPLGEGGGQT